MRFSLSDVLWLLFCVGCILGIAYANRPITYTASPLVELFSYHSIAKKLEEIEQNAWLIHGESNGKRMSIEILTSENISGSDLITHWQTHAENVSRQYARIILTKTIEHEDIIAGHTLEWKSNQNTGFLEIIHLGHTDAGIDAIPDLTRRHHLYITRREYWHPNSN